MPLALWSLTAWGQLDPVKRRVFQAGYSMPVHEDAPIAAYAFYYQNLPHYPRTNINLRMAIVPVYLDTELGFHEALGPNTDLGLGVSGGGFADSYNEFRMGNYLKSESFTGHAGEVNGVVYHLFNPGDLLPLFGVVRGGVHGSFYESNSDTDDAFEVPTDRGTLYVRSGLRLGGREPYLSPTLAGELSIWQESRYRFDSPAYGFNNDREVEDFTHQFWGRALMAYTFEESKQFIEVSLTAGTSVHADRFSAYRLGGSLSLMSEFPLNLPGYHIQEISADQFVQLSAQYILPLDASKHWAATAYGSTAVVDYLDGLEQPGNFHAGVGGGMVYLSPGHAWQLALMYAYGVNAIREDGRGAHSITVQLQYDFDADLREGGTTIWDPLMSAKTWRGLFRFFGGK